MISLLTKSLYKRYINMKLIKKKRKRKVRFTFIPSKLIKYIFSLIKNGKKVRLKRNR